jgi:hypothetical protein
MGKPSHFLPILLFAAISVIIAVPFHAHSAWSHDPPANSIASAWGPLWPAGIVANGNGAISPVGASYPIPGCSRTSWRRPTAQAVTGVTTVNGSITVGGSAADTMNNIAVY